MIKTETGELAVPIIRIEGMKRSPIVVAVLTARDGRECYSITHAPSGFALIPAVTDDLALATRHARKIWKSLDAVHRAALARVDFGPELPEFDRIGDVVSQSRNMMRSAVADRIRREVEEELRNRGGHCSQ